VSRPGPDPPGAAQRWRRIQERRIRGIRLSGPGRPRRTGRRLRATRRAAPKAVSRSPQPEEPAMADSQPTDEPTNAKAATPKPKATRTRSAAAEPECRQGIERAKTASAANGRGRARQRKPASAAEPKPKTAKPPPRSRTSNDDRPSRRGRPPRRLGAIGIGRAGLDGA
jgi:hypothetical protein